MNDDKLTDGVNKGSEDENNQSDGTVDSSFHNGNEGVNKTDKKAVLQISTQVKIMLQSILTLPYLERQSHLAYNALQESITRWLLR